MGQNPYKKNIYGTKDLRRVETFNSDHHTSINGASVILLIRMLFD